MLRLTTLERNLRDARNSLGDALGDTHIPNKVHRDDLFKAYELISNVLCSNGHKKKPLEYPSGTFKETCIKCGAQF